MRRIRASPWQTAGPRSSIIEAHPIATCVRVIMVDRPMWSGSESDHLWRLSAERAREDMGARHRQKENPRALAGRLRRAQTFLRTLGIESRRPSRNGIDQLTTRRKLPVLTIIDTLALLASDRSSLQLACGLL